MTYLLDTCIVSKLHRIKKHPDKKLKIVDEEVILDESGRVVPDQQVAGIDGNSRSSRR